MKRRLANIVTAVLTLVALAACAGLLRMFDDMPILG